MEMERKVMGRVMKRIVPFLMICYLFAFLDRVNIGFAALTMNRDLGISATAFGLAAGVFFLTYFLLEVPSNVALVRFGARRWIARIMITWGVLSAATAFVQGADSLYFTRALLGAAEAGFFPGIIFFLTQWFPSEYRARIVAYFMTALPVSSLIGSPISALLLSADGFLGLHGWQILFITEGIPSVILGFVVLSYLTDEPKQAKWLAAQERDWLISRLESERNLKKQHESQSLMQTLLTPKVLALGLANFGGIAGTYALGFFLPQIVHAFGFSIVQTGFISAVPYIFGMGGMVWLGKRSDRRQERKGHAIFALSLLICGLVLYTVTSSPAWRLCALSLAASGAFAYLPIFWTLPTSFLSGKSAAAAIGLINCIGSLAGFLGPYLMGYMKDATGNYEAGLLAIAGLAASAIAIILLLPHDKNMEFADSSNSKSGPQTADVSAQ